MGFLNKLFPKKKRTETYFTDLPPVQSVRGLGKAINKKLAQRNAELEAKLLKQKSDKDKKRLEKLRKLEEKKLKQDILKHKKIIELKQQQQTLKLVFKNLKKYPYFALRNKKGYYRLKGVLLQETDDGYTLYYPLLTDGKKEFIFKKYTNNFEDFFYENIGLVSQIKSGRVDTNFNIVDDQPVFISPKRVIDKKTQKEVEVIRLDEKERLDYENQIHELQEKLKYFVQIAEEFKKKENQYLSTLAEHELSAKSAIDERDKFASTLAILAEKQNASTTAITNALAGIQDIKTEQILTERMNRMYSSALEEARAKLQEALSQGGTEINEEKIMNLIENTTEKIKTDLQASFLSSLPSKEKSKESG